MNEKEYWKHIKNKYRMITSQYQRQEEGWGKRRFNEQPVHQFCVVNEHKGKSVRSILDGMG